MIYHYHDNKAHLEHTAAMMRYQNGKGPLPPPYVRYEPPPSKLWRGGRPKKQRPQPWEEAA